MAPVLRIFTCDDWGAAPARRPPTLAGKPDKTIFHHTYGHAPNLDQKPTQTITEAAAYARTIQRFHMEQNGWNDSGHSFLVTRGGFILEGRRGTVQALTRGRMIVSAHCPGQNDQPGVEHEHRSEAAMTEAQFAATVWLHAWICRHAPTIRPTEIYPHSRFYATACPAELGDELMAVRLAVARQLTETAEQNAQRLATLRAWIIARRAGGWTWNRIKATANWREFTRRGGT